jgi:hypothetical protein
MHRFHMEGFNPKKINDVQGKEKYHVELQIVLQLWKTWALR